MPITKFIGFDTPFYVWDLQWLAGILEGEGCFVLIKNPSGHYHAKIQIDMADKDIIERVSHLFGVGITQILPKKIHHKILWQTSVQGKRAIEVLRAILPYMGLRRATKIQSIIELEGTKCS